MQKRNKKKIVIGILCCMLVFMGIGYAALSQVLNIGTTAKVTGSWKIYISDARVNENKSTSKSTDNSITIGENRVSAVATVNFNAPGEYVTYDMQVTNGGTIDAILKSIKYTLPEGYKGYFSMEVEGLKERQELNKGDSKDFTLKITFDKDKMLEAMPDQETFELKLELEYIQGNLETSGTGGTTIPADDVDFEVDKNGRVVNVNVEPDSNGVMKVPATNSNGEAIKVLSEISFTKYNVGWFSHMVNEETSESVEYYYVTDDENFDAIKNKFIEFRKEIGDPVYENVEWISKDKAFSMSVLEDNAESPYEASAYVDLQNDTVIEHVERLSFKKVDLSNATNLTVIEGGTFADSSLQEVVFNEGLEVIGVGAFNNCQLTSISLPNSLQRIGEDAFDSNSITKLVIPSNVSVIEMNAFANNPLTSITVKRSKSNCSGYYSDGGHGWQNSLSDDQIVYEG